MHDSVFAHYDIVAYKAELQMGQQYIDTLMSEDAIQRIPGEGQMRVIKNLRRLETGKYLSLVIRQITEPFWQSCINIVDRPGKQYRVCAVGSPGIGKTTHSAYLIRMLLLMKRTVVYHVRTVRETGWIYEFAEGPTDNAIKCEVYPENKMSSIPSLRLTDTYYIVDPGATKDTCNPEPSFQPHVIIVSSPDERHWGKSEFLKDRGRNKGFFLFYPMWTLDEMKQAAPYLNEIMLDAENGIDERLSDDEIEDNYFLFGGVPSLVFADNESCKSIKKAQANAIRKLTPEQVESIALHKVATLETMDQQQPSSLVIGYGNSGPQFDAPIVVAVSPYVERLVHFRYMEVIWNTVLSVAQGAYKDFEKYCRLLMTGERTIQVTTRKCVWKSAKDFKL
jgi:hypothetical protein